MRYSVKKGVSNKWIEDEYGNQWEYIDKKEYQAKEEADKKIYGDFQTKDSQDAQRQLETADVYGNTVQSIGIYRYSANPGWSKTVVGYIPISVETEKGIQNGYIRIIKTSVLKRSLVCLAVLIAAVAVFLAWYIPNRAPKTPDLDEAAVAYHIEGMVNSDPNQIMLPGLGTIKLTTGQTHVEKVLLNPEGNPCYFQFRLVLRDTGETLYESGLVEPGKAIVAFDINRALEAGSYEAEVQIDTRSLEDAETPLNGGVIAVTLEVT